MALRVTIDGTPWLADVGFGGLVPPAPLRMDIHDPQPTVHEPFRLCPSGPGLMLMAKLGEEWQQLYELDLAPQLDIDYAPANWFTSKHPGSLFRRHLIVALATPGARYSLLDQRLTIRRPGHPPEQHLLDADGIGQALADTFGLPVEPAWRPIFEKAAGSLAD